MKSRQAPRTRTAIRRRAVRIATRTVASAACAVALALPAVVHASLLAASSVCVATSSYGTFLGNSCIRGDDIGQSGPGTIPGGSGVGSGVVGFGSSAGALQDYGVFHGYASAAGAGVAGRGEGGGATASARGIMDDLLTITGGTGFGYLTLAWTVSGSTTVDGYRGAYANLEMDVQTFASSSQHGSGSLFITQGGVYTIAHLPFFFGQPLDLNVSSSVVAASGYDEGLGGAYAFFAAADFSHTSTLTGITAFDVDGRRIDGITITSASGTRYPLSPDATPPDDPGAPGDPGTPGQVPEPSTWLLLAGGLTALAVARRGHRAKGAVHRSPMADAQFA